MRTIIDGKLRTRLANELGMARDELCAHLAVYHSFLPTKSAPLDASDARLQRCGAKERGPWTKEWAKPQPGQLLQATLRCTSPATIPCTSTAPPLHRCTSRACGLRCASPLQPPLHAPCISFRSPSDLHVIAF